MIMFTGGMLLSCQSVIQSVHSICPPLK